MAVVKVLVVAVLGVGIAVGSAGQALADGYSPEVSKNIKGNPQTTLRVSGGGTTGQAILVSGDYPQSAMASTPRGPNMSAVPQYVAGH